MPSAANDRSAERRPAPPAYWADATRALGRADPVMRRLIRGVADAHLTRRGDPFTTLARAVVEIGRAHV